MARQTRQKSKGRTAASRKPRSDSRAIATPTPPPAPTPEASSIPRPRPRPQPQPQPQLQPQLQPQTLLIPPITITTTTTTANPNAYPRIAVQPAPPLWHAMVDVELTADPILAIISKMSADAITDIQNKAAASGMNMIRDFDWAGLAAQAILDAEKTAKQQLMDYVTPVAMEAYESVREREGERGEGTPVVREVIEGEGEDEQDVDVDVDIDIDIDFVDVGEPIAMPILGGVVESEGINEGEVRALSVIAEEDGEDDAEMAFEDAVEVAVEVAVEGQAKDGNAKDETKAGDDSEMADVKDTEMGESKDAAADANHDDDDWNGVCFCGLGDVTGDTMVQCASGRECRHEWYHAPCLEKALRKGYLPTDDKDWYCPYCGGYGVKAAMTPETVFGKDGNSVKKGKKK